MIELNEVNKNASCAPIITLILYTILKCVPVSPFLLCNITLHVLYKWHIVEDLPQCL